MPGAENQACSVLGLYGITEEVTQHAWGATAFNELSAGDSGRVTLEALIAGPWREALADFAIGRLRKRLPKLERA